MKSCTGGLNIVLSQLKDLLLFIHVHEASARQDDRDEFLKQDAAYLPESSERCAEIIKAQRARTDKASVVQSNCHEAQLLLLPLDFYIIMSHA